MHRISYCLSVFSERGHSVARRLEGYKKEVQPPEPHTVVLGAEAVALSGFQKEDYVGSLDVPRPNSRVEIVAAMRRIRVQASSLVPSSGSSSEESSYSKDLGALRL
ncbi:hypothetical protein MG293_001050 [Ovis ammon polii]|uniref:Uncharacterized protein n=1 Tax=Ovis ammon polii TaxID=230172 RepID=A0AAD4URB4_OVIAM|nr:hypothetical protein MG293_001050 [Ovis ammon polii]